MYKTKYHLGSHFQACQLGTKIFQLVTHNSDQFVFERAHTLIIGRSLGEASKHHR